MNGILRKTFLVVEQKMAEVKGFKDHTSGFFCVLAH